MTIGDFARLSEGQAVHLLPGPNRHCISWTTETYDQTRGWLLRLTKDGGKPQFISRWFTELDVVDAHLLKDCPTARRLPRLDYHLSREYG